MIYTVTLNPAVDCVLSADKLSAGRVNRINSEKIYFGGKGINVSLVLRELGVESVAVGFTAGFTGAAIEEYLREQGVSADLVRLDSGFSRINVKIRAGQERPTETELNAPGPDIPPSALEMLYEKLDGLADGDIIVLAGSVPKSLPPDIYEQILSRLSGRGVRAVVDAAGALLQRTLRYKPFLVKPNITELGELFGKRFSDADEALPFAEKLREQGAANVLVSMAGGGAFLVDERGEYHRCGVCRGRVINSVGAGDSMAAGFIAGMSEGYSHALRLGTACGGATAFSEGLARRELIYELLEQLK